MITKVVAIVKGEEISPELKDSSSKDIISELKELYGKHNVKIKSVSTFRNPGTQAKAEDMRMPDTIINKPHKGKAYHSR